jgi:hypothetical protein
MPIPLRRVLTNVRLSAIRQGFLLSLALSCCLTWEATAQTDSTPTTPKEFDQATRDDSHQVLFDGKSLDSWTITEFGGQRGVTVVDGAIQLDAGDPLTGITWKGDPPRNDYELSAQARKLRGSDFFCAATFPVGEAHATLVLGGWGGTLVGISCLDGFDASENETTQYRKFEPERWYDVRIRVADQRIQCWLDGERIIDVSTWERKISLRSEVELSRPLGFCSFTTQAQLRNIQMRKIESATNDAPTK